MFLPLGVSRTRPMSQPNLGHETCLFDLHAYELFEKMFHPRARLSFPPHALTPQRHIDEHSWIWSAYYVRLQLQPCATHELLSARCCLSQYPATTQLFTFWPIDYEPRVSIRNTQPTHNCGWKTRYQAINRAKHRVREATGHQQVSLLDQPLLSQD